MSYQNNIAKESLSLQNHIVRLCFIFITQNTPIMHNPDFSQAIGSYFLTRFSFFQLSRNTWAWAMDIALWVEYNMMMEVVWRRQNGESLTSTRLINGLWRCPSIDVNVRSRDFHATDALRAISVWKLKLETKWVCIQLACSWRPRAFEEAHHRNIQAKFCNENSH